MFCLTMNPPTQPSATPRTDAATNYCDASPVMPWVDADFARTLETELAEAKAECERLRAKQPIASDLRQFDLVRFMRQELHAAHLITDEEYGWLCMESPMAHGAGSPSPRRLEGYDKLAAELARLRAEVERLTAQNRDEESWWREKHDYQARAERAELALANARCPHIVSTNEGTHYCAVAESTVAEARKDSQRFNLLASLLEDVNIGDIDPTKHCTEDNEWPDAWRDAIDAAMTNSKNT